MLLSIRSHVNNIIILTIAPNRYILYHVTKEDIMAKSKEDFIRERKMKNLQSALGILNAIDHKTTKEDLDQRLSDAVDLLIDAQNY